MAHESEACDFTLALGGDFVLTERIRVYQERGYPAEAYGHFDLSFDATPAGPYDGRAASDERGFPAHLAIGNVSCRSVSAVRHEDQYRGRHRDHHRSIIGWVKQPA